MGRRAPKRWQCPCIQDSIGVSEWSPSPPLRPKRCEYQAKQGQSPDFMPRWPATHSNGRPGKPTTRGRNGAPLPGGNYYVESGNSTDSAECCRPKLKKLCAPFVAERCDARLSSPRASGRPGPRSSVIPVGRWCNSRNHVVKRMGSLQRRGAAARRRRRRV